jgi:tetratricopeptide (TPR) repeat protein
MKPVRDDEVARLLKRGLNHYGLGDIDAAIACWERVKDLDPENSAARDYLETAYEEKGDAGDEEATPVSLADDAGTSSDDDATPVSAAAIQVPGLEADDADAQVAEALKAFVGGELESAWTLLQEVGKRKPERLDVQGYLGLVRAQRAKGFVAQIGDTTRRLEPKRGMQDLTTLNLKPDEGFLLSQIDGTLTVEELISLSTAGRVETLEILARFVSEGIVE